MYGVIQVAGSLLVLLAFVAALAGRIDQSGYPYLLLNAVGSTVLAATAVISLEWGFLLLEGVWALASFHSLVRKATRRSVRASH